MEVCDLCQKLRPLTTNESSPISILHPSIKHHRSLSELQTSSISCSLCRLMLSRIDLSLANRLPSWAKDYLSNVSIFVVHDRHDKPNGFTILSPRLCSTGPNEWELRPPSPLEYSGWCSDDAGSGYNIYSTDWKYYLLSNLAIVEDGNEHYINRALWDADRSQSLHERLNFGYLELQKCLRNHEDCREASSSTPEDPPPLPTRVIDVGYGPESDNAKARLIRSNGSKAHYTALSYCWGGGRTDESTIQELKQGVHPSKLAKTYEDAIYITRSLRIRYLWIDALCIMQNDPAEVEAEMASMANIYRDAQVSISASASRSLHGGCVFPLEPPLAVTFSVADSSSSKQALDPTADNKFLFKNLLHGLKNLLCALKVCNPPILTTKSKAYVRPTPQYRRNVLRSPLTTRGWTLQEDLIPSRTLYCAQDQIYWRCCKSTVTEDGVIDWPKSSLHHYRTYYDHSRASTSTHHHSEDLKGKAHRLRKSPWRSRNGKRNDFYLDM